MHAESLLSRPYNVDLEYVDTVIKLETYLKKDRKIPSPIFNYLLKNDTDTVLLGL